MPTSSHYRLAATPVLGLLLSVVLVAYSQQAPGLKELKLGDAASDFTLCNSQGKPARLKDFHGKKHVALVFYPALFRAGG